MRQIKRQPLNLLTCLVLLSACGGEGAKRDAPQASLAAINAVSFDVKLSSSEIKTGSADKVVIKVLAKDVGNAAAANVPVSFSATAGLLSSSSATTDATGYASVTLSSADDVVNKNIIVTTTIAGKVVAKSSVTLTGTELSIGGPSAVSVGKATDFVATLKDAGGKYLAGQVVSASFSGGVVSPATATTNTSGQATFSVTPGVGGNGTLSVSALGSSKVAAFGVSANQLSFTAPTPGTFVPTSTGCQAISILTSTANQNAMFSITRGQLFSDASCTTALSGATSIALTPQGTATVYASSGAPGDAAVQVTSGGSSSLPIKFISVSPSILLTQVSTSVVAPNGSADVMALLKDANGNPVEALPVYFSVPSGNGSVSTTNALTDSAGVAKVSFKAGSAPTAQNAVRITAAAAGVPDSTAVLTISSSAVSVSLGTDTTIVTLSPSNSYQIKYTATLADSSGAPLAGQPITLSRRFTKYFKGAYTLPSDSSTTGWFKFNNVSCVSEDTNGDGLLTPDEIDLNNNNRLDPDGDARLSANADGSNGSAKTTLITGPDGSATIYINFLQSYASWVAIELTASASVNGLNSTATRAFTLSVPSAALLDVTNRPPFVRSPFGVGLVCTDQN